MISLLSPDLTLIRELPLNEVDQFLHKENLSAKRLDWQAESIVVFDRSLDDPIAQAYTGSESVISGFRSIDELVSTINDSLAKYGRAIFVPSNKSMRHFFNTSGFVRSMRELDRRLIPGHRQLIPPGLYGAKHIFAVEVTEPKSTSLHAG